MRFSKVVLFLIVISFCNCYSQRSRENVIFAAVKRQKTTMNVRSSWVVGQIGMRRAQIKTTTREKIEDYQINQDAIKVFPNPTNHLLHITSSTASGITAIYLHDLLGNVLQSKQVGGGVSSDTLDVYQYTNGIYVVKIITNNKSSIYVRIVKE